MQEMIKKILEIDERARKLTDEADALKRKAEMSIEDQKHQLKKEYLDRARKKIESLRETETEFADKEHDRIREEQKKVLQSLSGMFSQNADKWVEEIVFQCLVLE